MKYKEQDKNTNAILPRGGKLSDLMRFAGTISKEDLAKMKAVIEEDCERIDPNEWRIPVGH